MTQLFIAEMELAVANFFNPRVHLIVPNVSWGMGIHECDLLILTKCGYANEVEIKLFLPDLKRDLLKRHGHRSNLIKRLFFAIPESLAEHQGYIPDRAGIIIVNERGCQLVRKAEINKSAKPFTNEQTLHFGRLAGMRIWSLKKTLVQRRNNAI